MNTLRGFLLALLALTVAGPVHAQRIADPTGSWNGSLQGVAGQQPITVRMQIVHDTIYAGSVDLPGSMVFDVSAPTRIAGDTVRITIRRLAAAYVGVLRATGDTIYGTWTQDGATVPLHLTLTSREPLRRRPQGPVAPFPYSDTALQYRSADSINIAGTLTIPAGAVRHPAVILISGSGGHDRHGAMAEHKPFDVIADHLARRGVAVLRFDERGIGASTGSYALATIHDFADDVLAGVELLRRHPGIDPERIGLIGHSEGGVVAPMVANRSTAISFVVLLAAPGVHMRDVGIQQTEAMARAAGMPEPMIARQVTLLTTLLDMFQADTTAEFVNRARPIVEAHLAATFVPLASRDQVARMMIGRFTSPMSQVTFRYDPAPALKALRVPVLALNGSLDTQVLPGPNLAGIRAAMVGSSHTLTVIELPGLNHLFQTARTGALSEYGVIEESFAPAALNAISDWIVSTTRPAKR
jgi:uncharacterized protein